MSENDNSDLRVFKIQNFCHAFRFFRNWPGRVVTGSLRSPRRRGRRRRRVLAERVANLSLVGVGLLVRGNPNGGLTPHRLGPVAAKLYLRLARAACRLHVGASSGRF